MLENDGEREDFVTGVDSRLAGCLANRVADILGSSNGFQNCFVSSVLDWPHTSPLKYTVIQHAIRH
jgi:hypothetical protein